MCVCCCSSVFFFYLFFFFFSSRRRHTRWTGDWSSDVCSSDLEVGDEQKREDPSVTELQRRWPRACPGSDGWPYRSEIGRASCRERSVDLGGRRIIKKKKKQMRDDSTQR